MTALLYAGRFWLFPETRSCETLAEVLAWELGVRVSAETVRRGLHRLNFVWRRRGQSLDPKTRTVRKSSAKFGRC